MILLCKAPAPGISSRVLSRTTRASFVSPGSSHLHRSAWRRASSIGAKNSSRFLIECKKKKRGKATKRSGNLENEATGSMKEYLELGMLLGDSTDETISRVEERFVGLDMNVEAQEIKEKLEEKERRAKKMDDLMDTVMKRGLDFENSNMSGGAPLWASNDKFENAWDKMDLEISSEDGLGGMMNSAVDYLENEDDLPEDFSYEDFENMISKLPDNLMDGTFDPPSQSQPPPRPPGRKGKTPKALPPTPQLFNKPSTPQARNFDEFQDMLREQSEHPDDFLSSNFEVVSEAPLKPKKKPIDEPVPSLHKPSSRVIPEEKDSDVEEEEVPSVDVVADFEVPEFKRPKLEKREERKREAKPVEKKQKKKKELNVPEMRQPVRKMEPEAAADGDGPSTKEVTRELAPEQTSPSATPPPAPRKPPTKADFSNEQPAAKKKKRLRKTKKDKPSTTPKDQPSKEAVAEELSSSSVSDSRSTTDDLLDQEIDGESVEGDDKQVPELHKPAFAGPVHEKEPPKKKPKAGKKSKATQMEPAKEVSASDGREQQRSEKDLSVDEKKDQESISIAEEEPVADKVLRELSFDESEPSEQIPETVGKPAMPSVRFQAQIDFELEVEGMYKLHLSAQPVRVQVGHTIDSGVFVKGKNVSGFLPFSRMAAGRMHYLTLMAAKTHSVLLKGGKIKRGASGIKIARKITLAKMRGKNLLVQIIRVDLNKKKVTFAEMGSTESRCPSEVQEAIFKDKKISTRGEIITTKVLATTTSAVFVECHFDGFNYPITGLLKKDFSLEGKKLEYGTPIKATVVKLLNGRLLLARPGEDGKVPGRKPAELIPGNIPEVKELCRLLEERPFILKAEPGARMKVASTTSSFQVLMDKLKDEPTEGVVEMTFLGRLDNQAQEIKISTVHEKKVIKGIIESVIKKL